uniref:Uncharacterized protein n=1 Tax=Ixodes ricinus TaxID=34613 RepID=A0A6B0U2E5_IXORI
MQKRHWCLCRFSAVFCRCTPTQSFRGELSLPLHARAVFSRGVLAVVAVCSTSFWSVSDKSWEGVDCWLSGW